MRQVFVAALVLFVGAVGAGGHFPVLAQSTAEDGFARQILAQAAPKRPEAPVVLGGRTYSEMKDKYNAWTVGLAAGLYEGAGSRFAAELIKAVDDGENMRVLPLLTKGLFNNVLDLLYLKGIDLAIVNGDILEHFKTSPEGGIITQRINYIANLYAGEVHILVPPHINSIADLEGKVVNVNTKTSATGHTGPVLFRRLGIKAIINHDPTLTAIADMIRGEKYSAIVFASSKPLPQFSKPFPPGFKLLPVPYNEKVEDLYMPTDITSKDYPNLIPAGEKVETVAVPTVLAVYDWPQEHDRHRRLLRFIDSLFDRLETLQTTPGNHPKWKEVSLTGSVPGWKRYPPMQRRIDAAVVQGAGVSASARDGGSLDAAQAGQQEQLLKQFREWTRRSGAPLDPVQARQQEQLFKQFLEWSKAKR